MNILIDFDYQVYRSLLQSDDKFIKACNIQFVDKSVPLNDSNGIYVAFVSSDLDTALFDGEAYRETVDLYVKTLQTDYLESSRFLRSIVLSVRKLLKTDTDLINYSPVIQSVQYEYGDNFETKGVHIVLNGKSLEKDPDEEFECICTDISKLEEMIDDD